ncbi:uncharacterized protein [Taeniopygia guttata]|uniref:uncharacterized protein isoform X2 n=1 Tax=Taeniopygia guttata TaxID=59729 RepID=UPI003BB8D54D
MGSQNCLWHFLLSVLLCTLMALEGRDTMTAATGSHLRVLRSTNSSNTTSKGSDGPGTAGATTQSPATPSPVTSTSGTNPASGTSKAMSSSTLGSRMETPAPGHSSTARPQPMAVGMATSHPTGSPSPSTATASAGSGAMTPPGEGKSSTTDLGDRTTHPTADTSHSLPSTSPVSVTKVMDGEGTTDGPATAIMSGGASLGASPRSGAVSSAFPTIGTGTTTGPESGTASPLFFSSAVTSHSSSSSSSSSSSPEGSSAVPLNPQQSSTTGAPLATTSHPSTSLLVSTAGHTDTVLDAVTAEEVTPSPAASTASTNPVASASETSAPSHSSSPGSSMETPAAGHSSPALPQPTELGTATSPPTGSPLPSMATASAGSGATTPPGEGESSTTNQEIRTTEPTANTSHFLPSTSLATPSTTNLSMSTSVNPGTCLPVSINVQKVTAEEIQLNWTSSSTGSFYISVKGDGKEIHAITTNETEAVFKNLLPGQKYTISVAVSSCAEKNPASVTVWTDSGSCLERTELCFTQSTGCSDLKGIVCSNNQAFACRVWLKNEIFNSTLYDSESKDYMAMSESFKAKVVAEMNTKLGNNHSDIFVLGFRSGSVIVDFLFLLPKEEAMDVDAIQTHLRNVLKSKFGSQSEVQTLSFQSSTDNCSSWRVAVIVLGVLLGVALVLILLAVVFYIHVRRSGMDFSTLYTW